MLRKFFYFPNKIKSCSWYYTTTCESNTSRESGNDICSWNKWERQYEGISIQENFKRFGEKPNLNPNQQPPTSH